MMNRIGLRARVSEAPLLVLVAVIAIAIALAVVGTPTVSAADEPPTELSAQSPSLDLAQKLAVSAQFSAARSLFRGTDESFVARIDYHLRFRSHFDFLSTDPGHIATVMAAASRNGSSEQLGLTLSDAEWDEMERRTDLRTTEIDIKRLVTGRQFDEKEEKLAIDGRLPTGGVYSGIWQDHMDGGKIKLAIVNGSAIDTSALVDLMPRGAEDLVIIEQGFSRDQLADWKEQINERFLSAGVPAGTGYDFSDEGVRISILPMKPGVDVSSHLKGIPDNAYTMGQIQAPIPAGDPNATHADPDLQSGLQIGTTNGTCTWGMTGHTGSYNYIITAGHCIASNGNAVSGWGIATVEQNSGSGNVISTQPSAFTYARWNDNPNYDHARVSSPHADTNCYHSSSGHCVWTMEKRLSLYGHESGDLICASLGNRNLYECGDVHNTDYDGSWEGVAFTNRIQANMQIKPGDSGSGMKWDYTFHGINTNYYNWLWIHYAYFEPAYYVKSGLGNFDLNCVRSGSWWGACPIVMD